jgi:competence protein ComGC
MRTNNKIPAFTLSETLVVLVITVIAVALGFSVLTLVTKQVNAITNKYEQSTITSKFKQRLLSDFESYDSIDWNNSLMQIELKGRDTIFYEITPEFILRQNDTIPLKIKEVTPYYLGKEASNGDIDGLHIEVEITSSTGVQLFISQRYTSNQEMEAVWD